MTSSTSRLVALAALGAQGCFTGHVLDETRRYERPAAFREAALDGEHLRLGYAAVVTDQFERRMGETERRVDIPLADLAGRHGRIATRPAGPGPRGQPIPLLVGTTCPSHDAPALTISEAPDGETVLVLCTAAGPLAPLPATALVRTRTPAWVYPLLPFTAALDAATNPVLLFFAPAVILTGD